MLEATAKELSSSTRKPVSVAHVALRWLLQKQGVRSIIIGARTLDQLNDNIGSLKIELGTAQMLKLDEISAVELPFPHQFLDTVKTVIQGGTSINGVSREAQDLSPKTDQEIF